MIKDYKPEGIYYPKGVVNRPQTARPYKYLNYDPVKKIKTLKKEDKIKYFKKYVSPIEVATYLKKIKKSNLKNLTRNELNKGFSTLFWE